MKKLIKIAVAAVMVFGMAFPVVAQQSHEENPLYGDTPEERTENLKKLNFLRDEIMNKNYAEAAVFLKDLMNDAPAASANIYIWGATIYKNKAARAKSIAEKKGFVDSVMMVYDRRVQYYGEHPTRGAAYIRQLKARDYASLDPLDREGVRKYYKEAVETAGATPEVAVEYFQQLVNDFKGYEIEAEFLLSEYEKLLPLMATGSEEEKTGFETLFASSGAASCENLEALFAPQLAADPNNVEILRKAFNLMSITQCNSDFYLSVGESYYALEPSSNVAIPLASAFENRQEYDKALKYLNEMVETETDPIAKANLYVRIAASELGAKHGAAAAQAARQAIALNSENVYAHLFLSEAYISGSSGCSGFNASAVFWLAYDELARARQLAGDDAGLLSTIDQRMANCRANFPTLEEGFMYVKDYQDGKSYTVNCGWVSGTTTIRSR